MKILVIRTHRLGDILQVTPMIAGLKQACPESELWFLVGDRFKDVLAGNPNIDRIVSFPIGQWRWQLKNNRPERFKIFNELCALVILLRNEQFDLIINRQYEFGAILSFLLGNCKVIGQSMRGNGAFFYPDQGSQALYNCVKSDRRGNSRNLVDWSIDIARVHPPDRSLCLTADVTHIIKTSGLLIENGVQPNDGLVGFQMGASKDFRRWGSNHFAVLAKSILRNADRKIILFGADNERYLGRELLEQIPSHERGRIINAIGKTSIKELGALLQRCSYLVTGDTGTMHMAAAAGTSVIALFYGPAYPFETGPYGDGHLVVWPDIDCAPCTTPSDCRDEFRCLAAITPTTMETAVGLMESTLNGNKAKFSHSDLPKSLFWATEMSDEEVQLFSVKDRASMDRFIFLCRKATNRPDNHLVQPTSASKEFLLSGLLHAAIHTGNLIVEDFDRGEIDAWAACASLFGVWEIIMDTINNSRIVWSKPALSTSVVSELAGLSGILLETEKALQRRDSVVVCDLIIWFMNPLGQKLFELVECSFPETLKIAAQHHQAERLQQASLLRPNYAEAYFNQGNVLQVQGQLDAAIESFNQALKIKPDFVEAYYNLGNVLKRQGRLDAAIESFNQAIKLKPDFAEAYNNLGNALRDQDELDAAIENFNQALRFRPNYVEAYYNLGNVLQVKGELDAAIDSFNQALKLKPDFVEAYYNLGNALKHQGRLDAAIDSFNQALRFRPNYAEAYNNLGNALRDQDELDAAIDSFNQALKIKPDFAEAYNNLGNALRDQDELDAAVDSFNQALKIKPDFVEAYNDLGNALQARGLPDAAIESFNQALRFRPNYVEAHLNRSLALLLCGVFSEGWKEYDWRLKHAKWKITFPQSNEMPRWDGSSFTGKRLFIQDEQGLGDTLQFVRYLPMVKARGGTVIFGTTRPLLGLLRGFAGIDELVEQSSDGKLPVSFDLYVPLMSLPRIFGTTLESIPTEVPYLHVDSRKAVDWGKRLADEGIKVGLVWAGNLSQMNLRNRSCSLERFVPLAGIPGVRLYGLQKGEGAAQVQGLKKGVVTNLGEEFEDFTDTAGAIENLDLVISVDTSVAHLAGAMGKPVWLLLPFAPDWRWLLDREDSPWYPTMRLFRQRRRGEWDDVFKRVADELRLLARKRRQWKGEAE